MPKITFSAIMHNDKKIIKTLSGRVGNFIFRTSQDGQIKAFFKPRPGTGLYRGNIETISRELREIASFAGLSFNDFNWDYVKGGDDETDQ